MCVYIHTYIYIYICIRIHMYTHIYIYLHMYIYIRIHIYVYIYTHTHKHIALPFTSISPHKKAAALGGKSLGKGFRSSGVGFQMVGPSVFFQILLFRSCFGPLCTHIHTHAQKRIHVKKMCLFEDFSIAIVFSRLKNIHIYINIYARTRARAHTHTHTQHTCTHAHTQHTRQDMLR